jgi:hypothetical protein
MAVPVDAGLLQKNLVLRNDHLGLELGQLVSHPAPFIEGFLPSPCDLGLRSLALERKLRARSHALHLQLCLLCGQLGYCGVTPALDLRE